MTPDQLTTAIQTLGLTAEGFARCAGVSGRAVQLWKSGERSIPGPVAALVEILVACKPAARLFTNRDLKKGTPT